VKKPWESTMESQKIPAGETGVDISIVPYCPNNI
jgi:hypothetical protein